MAADDGRDALGDQRMQLQADTLVLLLAMAELAGLEYRLDGAEQAVGVLAHGCVEDVALRRVDGMPLQRVQVEPDAGDGRLELVRDGVEKAVLALVAADLADKKDGVQHHAGDQDRKQDDADQIDGEAAAVAVNPGDVQRHRQRREAHAENDEEGLGSAAACEIHTCGEYSGRHFGTRPCLLPPPPGFLA